jgi:hypothetical protein
MGVVCLLLLVGAAFWYGKYRDINRRTHTLAQFGPVFQVLHYLLGILVLLIPGSMVLWWDMLHRDDVLLRQRRFKRGIIAREYAR